MVSYILYSRVIVVVVAASVIGSEVGHDHVHTKLGVLPHIIYMKHVRNVSHDLKP